TSHERTPEVEIQLAHAYNSLADVHRQRSEFADAECHFRESIRLFRDHKHPDIVKPHPDIVKPLLYLGFLEQSKGRDGKAEDCLKECLKEAEKAGKEAPAVADALASLGLLYLHIGQYPRAEGHLDCALAIYNKHFPSGNVAMARAMGNRASLFVK